MVSGLLANNHYCGVLASRSTDSLAGLFAKAAALTSADRAAQVVDCVCGGCNGRELVAIALRDQLGAFSWRVACASRILVVRASASFSMAGIRLVSGMLRQYFSAFPIAWRVYWFGLD